MATQFIYIVRHGQTDFNRDKLVQDANTKLSTEGHKQAVFLASRLKGFSFEKIFVSDMERAQQTAKYIADSLGLKTETVTDLREFLNPSSFVGMQKDHPDFQSYLSDRNRKYSEENSDWKFEDEESFKEFLARIKRVFDILTVCDSDVLAVSHGHTMRFMVAYILCGDKLTPAVWAEFNVSFWSNNTGITVFQRDTVTNKISLRTWNDHAYFAE